MKNNNWTIYLSAILNVLLVGLVIYLIFFRTGKSNKDLYYIIQQQDSILTTYINELDQKVFELTAKEFDAGLSKLLIEQDKRFAEFEKRLKINNNKLKDVISSVEFDADFIGQGTLEKIRVDTVYQTDTIPFYLKDKKYEYIFDDGFLSFKADTNRLAIYSFSPGLVFVDVFTKKKIFRSPSYSSVLSFENPHVSLNSSNVFVRSQPNIWLVIGPSLGLSATYYNNEFIFRPSVGINATIPIIRISKQRKNEFPKIERFN
jgi:hypothetical protein